MKLVLGLLMCLVLSSYVFAVGQMDIAYSPCTISQPGSYIVVKDLHVPQDKIGITISTSNVTLDLNGHTIYGAGTTVGSTSMGIFLGIGNNITVRNGIVRDFCSHGLYLGSGFNHRVSGIQAYGNGEIGIGIFGTGSLVTDCQAAYNKSAGIQVGYSSIVTGCSAIHNRYAGIAASQGCLIQNNTLRDNGTGIFGSYANQIIGNTLINQTDATYGQGIKIDNFANRIDSNQFINNRVGIQFDTTNNWYGRNTFYGNTSSVCGAFPSDPGSPYNNQYM